MQKNNQNAFLALLRAGLWEQKVILSKFEEIDFSMIFNIAEQQAVTGLVAAGFEHVQDNDNVPKEDVLVFVGSALQIEQRNITMNIFLANLIEKLRKKDIYTLLVKGQGIAQCYERPLWRASGDIDFFLSESNYFNAKNYLKQIASKIEEENESNLHLALTIDSWLVELHGTLRGGLWKKVDRVLNEIQSDIFYSGYVRSWMNGNTQIFLPRADEDVVFVFAHILQHFFRGGIGMRQICDWCRLLYKFKDKIDRDLLSSRLKKMGVMTEWRTFAALAVDYLGMQVEAIPFYDSSAKWKKKSYRLIRVIFKTGNFGHAKDYSYKNNYSLMVRLIISFWRHTTESIEKACIFPIDSAKMWKNEMLFAWEAIIQGKLS